MFLKDFIYHLANQIIPAICLLCGKVANPFFNLCQSCQKDLPILTHYCQKCAQILPSRLSICGSCLNSSPPYDLTFALFPYEKPIIHFIVSLKFNNKLVFAKTLAALLTHYIQEKWYLSRPYPDLILPVPLHPNRLRERGFNQALEIAKPISQILKIPIDINGLKRIKPTVPQSHLTSAIERKENMKNAFLASRDYSGLTIALLDDVVTTSHTVSACSDALKMSGAKEVHVWCCARRQ